MNKAYVIIVDKCNSEGNVIDQLAFAFSTSEEAHACIRYINENDIYHNISYEMRIYPINSLEESKKKIFNFINGIYNV